MPSRRRHAIAGAPPTRLPALPALPALAALPTLAALALIAALGLAGCDGRPDRGEAQPRLTMAPTSFDALPGWETSRVTPVIPALARRCTHLAKRAPDSPLRPVEIGGTASDWRPACAALAAKQAAAPDGLGEAAARAWLRRWFQPWSLRDRGRRAGLFTGYFVPEIAAAPEPRPGYEVPIHGRPDDLVALDLGHFRADLAGRRLAGRVAAGRLVPYASRAEIRAGALDGRAPVLAWARDRVDVFFLHIQGSGRLRLPGGATAMIGYAGDNGHRYRAIGRELVARGEMTAESVSLPSLRAWLAAHPDRARAIMNANPSYVFFARRAGRAALGALGTPLTPGRSLAVDRRYVPLGAPVWLDSEASGPAPALARLMIAEDTGGAIRGPVRGDVFWGYGAAARRRAGHMKASGRAWLLLPRAFEPDPAALAARLAEGAAAP